MKEQKLDDLERMFSDGLKNLEAEPDAVVWTAIQDAMKKRRRFWLFWSVAGIVALGLVATVLLQNRAMDHGPLTTVEREVGDIETRRPGDLETRSPEGEVMRGSGDEEADMVRHTERSRRTTDGPEPTEHEEMRGLGDEEADMVRHPERSRRTAYEPEPTEHEEMRGSGDEEADMVRHTERSRRTTDLPESTGDEHPQIQPILSIPIFLKPFNIQPYTALDVSAYKPENKKDSAIKYSPWSIAFNPGILLPSIHSYGKQGTVNYDKTNQTEPGISFGLNLNYRWKENWILRTGFDWSSYTVSGNQRYYGLTDTVEWIDRERNTGVLVIPNDRSWTFETQYTWLGIPVELGRSQNLGHGFSWEWTLGAGINYLYRPVELSGNNRYLSGIDQSLRAFQLNLSAGFGVYYQVKGPWSTFVNVKYRYQPNHLYQSDLLQEKHQLLRFGFGLQYQFKRKGN